MDAVFNKPENRLPADKLADPSKNPFHDYWKHRAPPTPEQLNPKRPYFRAIERIGVYLWNHYIVKWEGGLMPRAYNFKVHGPYVPWRNYGFNDTPFKDVKMGELPQWLMRREKSPLALYRALMRNTYWWLHRYGNGVRWPNGMHFIQGIMLATFVVGLLRNPLYINRKKARYHW